MVVGMSLYSQIREAYVSGESQRSIAKRLGISRQTVKKYCEGETMPGIRKEYLRVPSVITPEIEKFIRMCLDSDKEEGLRKQTHTAKRIYDRLVAEQNFTGSYSIVRRVVHEMKVQYIPAQADMPLEYDPGDAIRSTGAKLPFTCRESGKLFRYSAAGYAIAATSLSWPVWVRMLRVFWRPSKRCLTTLEEFPGGSSLTMEKSVSKMDLVTMR